MALLRRCRQCRMLVLHQQLLRKKTPVQETRRTISLRPLRSLSSWGTTSLPWLRYQQESPVDLELLRKQESVRKKWQKLEGSLHNVVRRYFQENAFPKEFAITRRQELWGTNRASSSSPSGSLSKTSSSSSPSRPSPPTTGPKQKLSAEGERLLRLNGFDSVPLPKQKDVLDLAEGVVIAPAPLKEIKGYSLYVQPADKKENGNENRGPASKKATSSDKRNANELPVFMEEDFTLYRFFENQAAVFLDHQYNAFTRFFEVYIDEPSKRIAERVESSGLYNLLVDEPKPTSRKPPKTALIKDDDNDSNDNGRDDKIRHINPSVNLELGEEPEPLQNLLVMCYKDDELAFYEQMTPSTRIAALPNEMGHNSASTLVHVSLVIFGALPLAYRSYVFALNYPSVATSVAASVVLTISYGIWSHRTSARTNQSRVVANALLHRVYARGDAVVYALQEGAVRRTTRAILHEYYQQALKSGHKEFKLLGDKLLLEENPSFALDKTESVNPTELALKLGLLKLEEPKDGRDEEMVPMTLDEALSSLHTSALSS